MNTWHHLPDIYFLHIPKTAGTSVRALLVQLFPVGSDLPVFHLKDLEALPDDAIRACRFASGHFGWRLIERAEAAGKQFLPVTFLRDVPSIQLSGMTYAAQLPLKALDALPEHRVAAARQLIDRSKTGYFQELVTRDGFDIENLRPLPEEMQAVANMMVRHLAGPGVQTLDPIPMDAATVRLAKERLFSMSFGIVEEMDKSWAVISAKLGLPLIRPARLNRSKQSLSPSDVYRKAIRKHHSYDDALYQDARRELDRRHDEIRLQGGDLRVALRKVFLATDRNVPRIRDAVITMGDGLVYEGFGPRHRHKSVGPWIRWAGPEQISTVYLPLDPAGDRPIRFDILATASKAIQDGLALKVNGHDIALQRARNLWPYKLVCSGVIPQAAMEPRSQYTALDFHVPEVVPQKGRNGELNDPASFALASIRIGHPPIPFLRSALVNWLRERCAGLELAVRPAIWLLRRIRRWR